MNQLSTNTKYAIINILSQIMKSDGIIHPKEEDFMDKIYEAFGIKIINIEDLVTLDDNESIRELNNMTIEQRLYARNLFLSMAESDGYIHPKEMEIIKRIFN